MIIRMYAWIESVFISIYMSKITLAIAKIYEFRLWKALSPIVRIISFELRFFANFAPLCEIILALPNLPLQWWEIGQSHPCILHDFTHRWKYICRNRENSIVFNVWLTSQIWNTDFQKNQLISVIRHSDLN